MVFFILIAFCNSAVMLSFSLTRVSIILIAFCSCAAIASFSFAMIIMSSDMVVIWVCIASFRDFISSSFFLFSNSKHWIIWHFSSNFDLKDSMSWISCSISSTFEVTLWSLSIISHLVSCCDRSTFSVLQIAFLRSWLKASFKMLTASVVFKCLMWLTIVYSKGSFATLPK